MRIVKNRTARASTQPEGWFKRQWWVSSDYEIRQGEGGDDHPFPHPKEGILMPISPAERFYNPMVHKEIAGGIAKLRNGDKEAILRFARAYGGFGHQAWIEELKDHFNYCFFNYEAGDPLPWIVAHANTIHACLSLIEILENGDPDEIKGVLDRLHEEGSYLTRRVAIRGEILKITWRFDSAHQQGKIKSGGPRGIPHLTDFAVIPDWPGRARYILMKLINDNITSIYPEVSEEKKPRLFFSFSSLVEAAYWHLANSIGKGNIRHCEAVGCGAFFFQTDPRQRYCPKGPFSKESPCAVRERVRKHRQERSNDRKQYRKPHMNRSLTINGKKHNGRSENLRKITMKKRDM